MSLESPRRVRLNRAYFTIFRAKVWKILIFEWIFFFGNSKKLGLEGKISQVHNLFTLLNLEIF